MVPLIILYALAVEEYRNWQKSNLLRRRNARNPFTLSEIVCVNDINVYTNICILLHKFYVSKATLDYI